MTDDDQPRRSAEEKARRQNFWIAESEPEKPPPMAIRSDMSELYVHQIELEMQNEELRRAYGDLESVRSRYIDLYDHAPVGYCTISETGMITRANLTASTMLGVPRAILQTRPFSRFIFKEDADHWYLNRKRLFKTWTALSFNLRMSKEDGSVFWAHLDATAVSVEGDEPICRLAFSDITEVKRVEEALAQALRMDIEVRKNADHALKALLSKMETQVQERTKDIRSLEAEAFIIEDRERQALAVDLHDHLGQTLHVVTMKLNTLLRGDLEPEIAVRLRELATLIKDASGEARSITSQLSLPELNTLGLVPALDRMVREMKSDFDLMVHVECSGIQRRVPRPLELFLFRSARELLINVAKHAQVPEAACSLLFREDGLTLVVKDSGRGFAEPDADTFSRLGFGLRSIRERAIHFGGELMIKSGLGAGSLMEIHVPLPSNDPLLEGSS